MSEQIVDLRSIWAILRRHTQALAVAAVIGGAAGGAALQTQPTEYSSTSVVLFPPVPAGAAVQASQHAIGTQVEIARSDAVLARAGHMLDAPLNSLEVADRVGVETRTDEMLTISARGATAADAEALAEAVAKADIDYLRVAASNLSNDQAAAMVKRKSTLSESLDAVQGEIEKTTRRLASKTASTADAKVDAVALSQLTARQAELVLQIDAAERQMTSQSGDALPSGGPKMIGTASPAQSLPPITRGVAFVGLGAAVALIAAAAFFILRGRREKALRSRDQIADSIGVPVVASVHSRPPRSVAGWVSLLRGYSPSSTDAWALHQLVQRFTTDEVRGALPGGRHRPRAKHEDGRRSTRFLVLTLAGDQSALAFGPQLASFSSGRGTQTRLVTTSQRHESTTSLRAACSRIGSGEQPRPGLFLDSRPDVGGPGELVVHTVSVSRQQPAGYLPALDDAVTLLAVSSGAASAEDLAALALAADEAGMPLDGIVVTNPDPLDRTTGRLLATERAVLAPLPSLMTGAPSHGDPPVATALGRKR